METKISSCFIVCIVLVALQLPIASCLKSPCSRTTCPSYTNEISSSGNDDTNDTEDDLQIANKYSIEIQEQLAAGGVKMLEITLMLNTCIPYDVNAMAGPKFYKLEAISQTTGETVGEFIRPPFHTETELCPDNIIAFETVNPTVLDMPRSYRWKPTSIVEESVCFKATIHHYPENTCETVIKCLSSAEIPEPPIVKTPAPPTETGIIIVSNDEDLFPYHPGPSAGRIATCNNKWPCHEERFKTRPHCGCNLKNNRCKTFQKKCDIRRLECLYNSDLDKQKGTCPEPPTEPPTPVPTSAPTPPPFGLCKILASNPRLSCTSSGDYKLTQCRIFPGDTDYTCYCTRHDTGEVFLWTAVTISTCESPQTYNLRCIR